MFKDVWKRFGAKALLVLCSVLLLGGVAIAAPRLRASNERVDLRTVVQTENETQAETVSGAAIWIPNPSQIVYNTSGQIIPTELRLKKADNTKETLRYDNGDYLVFLDDKVDNNAWNRAGKVTVTIQANNSTHLVANSYCTLEYTILKAAITSITPKVKNTIPTGKSDYAKYDDQDALLVANKNSEVSAENIEVQVNGETLTGGKGYRLKKDDGITTYTIGDLGGSANLYIEFDNYRYPNGPEGCAPYTALKIYGDLGRQVVTVSPEPTNPSNQVTADNITITDNEGVEIPPIEYGLPEYAVASDAKSGHLKITGAGKAYLGYYENDYPFTQVSDEDVMLVCVDSKFQTPQDFVKDLKGDYRIHPTEFQTMGSSPETVYASQCSEFEYQIVASRGSHKGIPGATAGLVEIKFQINSGTYTNRTGYAYFPVIRDIADAEYDNAGVEGIKYIYGQHNKGQYKRETEVWFTDAPDSSGKNVISSYEVTYKLKKWNGVEIEGIENIEDAGRVYMTISGEFANETDARNNAQNGGYYGKIEGTEETPGLYYDIEKQPLTNEHFLKLGTALFAPSNTEPDVETGTSLCRGGTVTRPDWTRFLTTLQDRYVVKYYESQGGNEILSNAWSGKTGTFWTEFTFSGNFEGTVGAEFQIQDFDLEYMHIEFGSCPQCGKTDGTHLYTGTEHHPRITRVYYDKDPAKIIEIPESEYNQDDAKKYLNAINATTSSSKASVQLTLNNDMVISQEFDIQPRALDDGTLTLTGKGEDEFGGQPNQRTHEYTGQTKLPAITKLVLETSDGFSIPLEKGKDFTVDAANLGIYDGNGTKITVNNAQKETLYVYRVSKLGNNFVNSSTDADAEYQKTEQFKIEARDINAAEIQFVLDPKPYKPGETEEGYLEHISKLVVTDSKFPGEDPLVAGTHYQIKQGSINDSELGEYSRITYVVEGIGFYKLEKSMTLYVGRDITKAKVIEKDELDITQGPIVNGMPSGSVTLKGPYATAKSEANGGVKFVTTNAESGVSLIYYLEDSFGRETLYNTNQYKVTYDLAEARPEDPTDKDSPLYGIITLTGRNGYYGSITVRVPIQKVTLKDDTSCPYIIKFMHTDPYDGDSSHTGNIYTGEELEPEFRVVLRDDPDNADAWLELGNDYEVATNGWHYNTNASEGRGSFGEQPYVEIRGIGNYDGALTGKFTIFKRDIGKEDDENHLVMSDGFTTEGWRNPVHTYTYTPFTKTDEGESRGVLPQVKLFFNGKELTMGSDYRRSYVNERNACRFDDSGVTYEQLPKVYFDADTVNSRNFKGKFYETYEIQPITLSDEKQCEVSLVPSRKAFTGSPITPDISVKILRDDGTTYDMRNEDSLGADKDYQVIYNTGSGSDTFISVDQKSALRSYVSVEEATSGNFEGKIPLDYVIYGQFQPESASGKKNSLMVVEGGEVNYNPASRVGGCNVVFYEKLDSVEGTLPDIFESVGDDESKARRHVLKENGEYVVDVPNRIGIQEAVITPNVNYFEGSAKCNITIKGNLDAAYIHYTFTSPVTYPVGGKDFHLENFLSVTYDGENGQQIPLVYGTDYEFASEPTINIGENRVNIRAIEGKSDEWLTGTKEIVYNLTADLDGATLVNVNKEYPYAHGVPVIKPEEIRVSLDGTELNKNDYTVTIEGDATNVGTHKIIVTGTGSKFSGTCEWEFRIVPYKLEDAVAEGIITVNYPEEVVYTGSKVWPSVRSIRIASHLLSDGTAEDESGALINAEYETDGGSDTGVDYVNWTRDGAARPSFIIRGKGNYTGEISYPYSIIRKDIGDEENVILDADALADLYYNNGKEIVPIPVLRYNGRDLAGIQYDSNNTDQYRDWQDYAIHFTYQHNGDLKRVGTKSIVVRGIGNFRGERTITYEVKPLNIADTELVFTGDTPIYDGNEQRPAFNLVYGDVILQYNGSRVISDNITDVNVKFDNNINATKEGKLATVTVSIPEDAADNYYGTKEATFSIQPASLTGHAKFMYHPGGENAVEDLSSYRLNLPFEGVGTSVIPQHPKTEEELGARTVGVYYQYPENRRVFLISGTEADGAHDYEISYQYVEPDTDDVEIREGFGDAPTCSYAGKVKVTITGVGNYTDSVNYWYFIGKDIAAEANISINPTTTVYNAQVQTPTVTITGVDKSMCTIGKYKGEVAVENLITDKGFVDAGDYYIRVEGDPKKGTYSTQPQTLKYTITSRPISSGVIIDGYKKEYAYTGFDICPVGISVTDYIDKIKYKLTEEVDYTLTYTNNLNAGTATINVNGQNNFSGTATAKFLITSSTITSGGSDWNSPYNPGTGEISGATAIKPDDVKLTMDTSDAMYYTGNQVFPKVSIAGMTENIDYTVTYSNNVEVGMATIYVSGIGNNNGMITKNFNIVAQLSKCTVAPIPAQRYTGSPITPTVTLTCGSNILVEGTDYVVSYANNVNIGTATVSIRSANNSNYLGSTTATFSIGNDVGGFIISGYAPSYVYTGTAITPAIVVETGSATLTQGTDYTVTYSNNVDAGMATITVTGVGRYSGTQTANFIIEPKSMTSLATSAIEDKTYTGDAYTPSITVTDGDKVLTNGVDYTVTYTNNTAPGLATAVITATSNNYTGTKIVSFKIAGVAVTGLKASSVTYKSLKLTWTKQDYADGYQICDSQSKGIKSTTKNSVSITGLTGGKTYKYKVRSFIRNADGTRSYGAFSTVVSATTKLKTPTVKIVSTKKGQARLSWTKVTGATGYEIYYKSSAKAKYRKLKTINNVNTRICTVKGMKSKSRAYFRVRAFKKSGSKKIYSALNPLKVITIK